MNDFLSEPLNPRDLPFRLGRYRVLSVLGEGGMARVFRAELLGPAGFRKPVALKVLRKRTSDRHVHRPLRSLRHEARLGGLLKHPNIVDIYELGEHEGCEFISMELVNGLSLRQLLKGPEGLPGSVFLDLAMGMAAGLAQAQAFQFEDRLAGLVHRDLKPSNILISWNGEVKIADFGIAETANRARHNDADDRRSVAGTPLYMSPEQIQGRELDGRSDLFSLALVFFEMATGRRLLQSGEMLRRLPHAMKTQSSILMQSEQAELDACISGLGSLVYRSLQPLPGLRYPNASSLLEALKEFRGLAGHSPDLLSWLRSTFPDLSDDLARASSTPSVTREDVQTPTPVTQLAPHQPRSNLGPALDRFIGRTPELDQIQQRIQGGARLVSLKGTGGAGKTRLARQYARGALAPYGAGTWFIDLTEAHSAMSILHALSQVLGIPLAKDWELEALVRRVGHAIAARGPMLLILDNFEQVLEHAAETVGSWLEMAPQTVFLVTTREALRISGEQVIDLNPLSEPDGIELFQVRAAAFGSHWNPTPANHDAIRHIIHELDGIPLAIELAASRTVHLPPTTLHERLRERFKLLGGARRDHGDRQATLWGLINWSWTLLKSWEQAALAQLSVFRDGFSLESAEAVLELSEWPEAPWVLDVIGTLLDKSLLHSREVLDQPRFSIYLSVRDFAAHKLDECDPTEETRRRFATHFAEQSTESAILALAQHGGTRRQKLLATDLDNCLAAAEYGIQSNDAALATGCALAAVLVLQNSGPFITGVELLDRVLHLPGLGDVDRFRLLEAVGELKYYAGKFPDAQTYLDPALEQARLLQDPRLEGRALNLLGAVCHRRGQLVQSRIYMNQALTLAIEHQIPEIERRSRRNLAVLHKETQTSKDCLHILQDILRFSREQGDRGEEALNLANLAVLELETGRVESAEAHYRASLRLYHELQNHRMFSITQGNLANLVKQQGRTEEARQLYQHALQGIREIGDRRAAANVLGSLGNLHRHQGRLNEAEKCLFEASEIAKEIGHPFMEALVGGNLGDVLLEQGRLTEARASLQGAIQLCQTEYPKPAGAFMGSLALIEVQEGHVEEAWALLKNGEANLQEGNREELAKLICKRGRVSLHCGDAEAAWRALHEAQAIGAEIRSGTDSDLGMNITRLEVALAAPIPEPS